MERVFLEIGINNQIKSSWARQSRVGLGLSRLLSG